MSIQIQCLLQLSFQFFLQGITFQFCDVSGTEVINRTIENPVVFEFFLDVFSTLAVFNHHQEICIRQGGNQSPIIRIAGYQDKRLNIIAVKFLASTCRHLDINQGFIVIDPFHFDVFHFNIQEVGQT